ncbi:MAG: CHASE2 domain-containing protein, partial [Akkermansiaceae bacterium]|nr:CHASE2 domain-containing protein [Akkermansiaceae bacterium]
ERKAVQGDGERAAGDGERQTRYLSVDSYEPRSLYELFVPDLWQMRYGGGDGLAGKVVLVGPTAPRFQDNHRTPSGHLLGPQLHLQALGCLLEDSFWKEPPPWAEWALLAGLALAGMVLVRMVRNPVALLGAVLALAAALVLGCGVLADRTGVLFTGFPGLLALLGVTISGGAVEFFVERARRRRLHRHLQRSVSADVADQMVRSPGGYFEMARGRRRKVVVLFSDVRGFTARSEQTAPEELVEQLNEYFSRMVRIVFSRGGTLDKFIGDAVMATWGGLSDEPYDDLVQSAVSAAAEMQKALEELNADWERRGLQPFEAGIGIHFGEAVVGEIGSDERSDFTAIGDAVNVASRIEGLTKHLQVPVLMTGEAAAKLGRDHSVLGLGRFGVAGRKGVLELYTLANGIGSQDTLRLGSALERIERGEWDRAAEALESLGDDTHLEGLVDLYLGEIEKARSAGAGEWNGVVRLGTK